MTPLAGRKGGAGGPVAVVMGWLVRGPLGGMAWHHLQYVIGLLELGYDVFYIEDSGDHPGCYHPATMLTDTDPADGLAFVADAFDTLGMGARWSYYDAHTGRWLGPVGTGSSDVCRDADLLLNVSGVNQLRSWTERIPVRILIDTDPLFSQLRHLHDPAALTAARTHTHWFSFGENIGTSAGRVPDDGLPWLPTRQPVALDVWQGPPPVPDRPFTTVMQWTSYEGVVHAGQRYGMKADSFGPFLGLPGRVDAELEIALLAPPEVEQRLRDHGWVIRRPQEVAGDPWTYRDYVHSSAGELAVAKHGYVAANTGWFSERSAAYLASGRPVIVQATGFDELLPTGVGLLSFRDEDEAVTAIERVRQDYRVHSAAAREVARAHFAADVVLSSLIARAGH